MLYSGDDFYGDDVTSGPDYDQHEADIGDDINEREMDAQERMEMGLDRDEPFECDVCRGTRTIQPDPFTAPEECPRCVDSDAAEDEGDLGDCPYFARFMGDPGADPLAVCYQMGSCVAAEEPLCVTCVPAEGWSKPPTLLTTPGYTPVPKAVF